MTLDTSTLFDAYVAGFFDGEGCVTSGDNGRWSGVRVNIAQKYLPVLTKIKGKWGGKISKTTSGCYLLWYTKQSEIKTLLTSILPYLQVKQLEVTYALAAVSTESTEEGRLTRELLIEKMRDASKARRAEEFKL